MKKLMQYLFYKFYKLSLIVDIDKIPEWKAYFLLSCFEISNFFVIMKLFDSYVLSIQLKSIVNFKPSILIIFALVTITNYFFYIKGKKYLRIEQLFMNESRTKRIIGNIAVILYIIISIVFLALIWIKK